MKKAPSVRRKVWAAEVPNVQRDTLQKRKTQERKIWEHRVYGRGGRIRSRLMPPKIRVFVFEYQLSPAMLG